MDAEKRSQLETLILETNTGLVEDDEFTRRAAELGVTDEEIVEMFETTPKKRQ